MVLRKAPMVGFCGAMAGLPVWGAENRHIEKIEKHGVLAISGRHLVATSTSTLTTLTTTTCRRALAKGMMVATRRRQRRRRRSQILWRHTTIKQITGRGVVAGDDYDYNDDNDNNKGSGHDNE
jgi:hypothetical protein